MEINHSYIFAITLLSGLVAAFVFVSVNKDGAINVGYGKLKLGWISLSVFLGCLAFWRWVSFEGSLEIFRYSLLILISLVSLASLLYGAFYTQKHLIQVSDKLFMSRKVNKDQSNENAVSPKERVKSALGNNEDNKDRWHRARLFSLAAEYP